MDPTPTVKHLISKGGPLDGAEALAAEERLDNPVSWVASLRPYPPAFPQLRGGELALVATENLARLDPPTTLADVVRYLASRDAAAVAVRGEVGLAAIEAAAQAAIPLLRLQADAPMYDIEQAVMRACAIHQARREMLSVDAEAWVDALLSGEIASNTEAQAEARRQGYNLAVLYSVAYLPADGQEQSGRVQELEAGMKKAGFSIIVRAWGEGIAVLLPEGSEARLISTARRTGRACGIGTEKPLAQVASSLREAHIAAIASAHLYGGAPAHYSRLGADRLIVLLWMEHPDELRQFVEETLGPLLRHDARSATPLLPTVRSFIEHSGRLRETAAEIVVHRNTLAYRLDRAAEILGVDLKDADARLAIEMALRALPLVRASDAS